METIVSLVGKQPSAVAVALATWMNRKSEKERQASILLLATRAVMRIGERLQRWVQASFPYCLCPDPIEIHTELGVTSPLPSVDCEIQAITTNLSAGEQLVFLGDAGLKYQVVAVTKQLPRETMILHADDQQLYIMRLQHLGKRKWHTIPLVDLGMENLLFLYDLEKVDAQLSDIRAERSTLLKHCLQQTGIHALPLWIYKRMIFHGLLTPCLDLSYESKGQLHALVVIATNNPKPPAGEGYKEDQGAKKTRDRALQEIRNVQVLARQGINGLKLRLSVLSPQRSVRDHALDAGCQAIDSNSARTKLRAWIKQIDMPPGQSAKETADLGLEGYSQASGGGGSGPALLIFLGSDPSATLLSICTHKPRQAWILYDESTPKVAILALRLKDSCKYLPVSSVHFIPTDHLGTIPVDLVGTVPATARVDITPGTKAQGNVLARHFATQLWSLRAGVGNTQPLEGGRAIAVDGPDLLLCATVNGGTLESAGKKLSSGNKEELFYILLMNYSYHAQKCPEIRRTPSPFLCACECSHGSLDVTEINSSKRIRVSFSNQFARGIVRSGGACFESLVGYALLRAGADEVRTNLSWAWQESVRRAHRQFLKKAGLEAGKGEADVVAKFGYRYVIASCKSGKTGKGISKLTREIEAVTSFGVGRFGLPVLARPAFAAETIASNHAASEGPLYLDLKFLVDSALLQETVQKAFRRRSFIGVV